MCLTCSRKIPDKQTFCSKECARKELERMAEWARKAFGIPFVVKG